MGSLGGWGWQWTGQDAAGIASLAYVFRDEFTTTDAAPLTSPRTCEPGPGTLTATETSTGAALAIASGEITMARPSGGGLWTNYGFITVGSYARVVGRALYGKLKCGVIDRIQFGWLNTSSLNEARSGLNLEATTSLKMNNAGIGISLGASLTAATYYELIVVLLATGYAYFIKGGTQYPSYSLVYVGAIDTLSPMYALLTNLNSSVTGFDNMTIYDLPAPFTSDYGFATFSDTTPTANDTATATADGLMAFTWTPAAAETLSLYFRRTDDDNCYRLDCDQAGSTIKLYRRDLGVDTELNSGKTQTWTAGTQYRIVIRWDAGNIRTFTEVSTTTAAKHVVTGESSYLAVTGIKCAGFATGANWVAYPYTFAGAGDVTTLRMA